MLGPTGIGVLWGSLKMLESLPPFLSGGEMSQSGNNARNDALVTLVLRRGAGSV